MNITWTWGVYRKWISPWGFTRLVWNDGTGRRGWQFGFGFGGVTVREGSMIWNLIAWVVSRQPIADWLIRRAKKTPYVHIDGYMNRWWLFNGYRKGLDDQMHKTFEWLPSVRVHHILRKDFDRVPHDHPWDARTIILKGWYDERRAVMRKPDGSHRNPHVADAFYFRRVGDTATLKFNEYHTVTEVSPGGVWTLFFTWKYQGGWGFWVDGKKVPYREYLEKKL